MLLERKGEADAVHDERRMKKESKRRFVCDSACERVNAWKRLGRTGELTLPRSAPIMLHTVPFNTGISCKQANQLPFALGAKRRENSL